MISTGMSPRFTIMIVVGVVAGSLLSACCVAAGSWKVLSRPATCCAPWQAVP
nr:hypothetical protein [Alcaligenes sp. HPC1271]